MWHIPFISALGRQRQRNLREFKASLVYRASSKTTKATHRDPVLKNKKDFVKIETKLPEFV